MPGARHTIPADNERRQVNVAVDARKARLLDKICEMRGVTRVEIFNGFLDEVIKANAGTLREDIATDAARSAAHLALIDSLTPESTLAIEV